MSKLDPAWLHWPETQKLVKAFPPQPAGLRFVGGAVRDAILGRPVTDVDAATPLHPEAVMALLAKAGIKALPTGIAHGTVTAVIGKKSFEITTLRRDIATDGRHAQVAYTDDWQADASRRDFTMNALYLTPAGELFDYFDGVADAEEGRVQFIGDPSLRIAEDYLRILRFFRFYAHYGKVAPDPMALAACAARAAHIKSLSGERLRQELLKLLAAPAPSEALQLMQERKILTSVLGFSPRDCSFFARLQEIESLSDIVLPPSIKLAGFLFSVGAQMSPEEALDILTPHLKLPNAVSKDLAVLVKFHKELEADLPESEQKRLVRRIGPTYFGQLVLIHWADKEKTITADARYLAMLRLAKRWDPPLFPVTGADLIKRGMQPGREMGALLQQMEEAWEGSNYRLTKQELLSRIQK